MDTLGSAAVLWLSHIAVVVHGEDIQKMLSTGEGGAEKLLIVENPLGVFKGLFPD